MSITQNRGAKFKFARFHPNYGCPSLFSAVNAGSRQGILAIFHPCSSGVVFTKAVYRMLPASAPLSQIPQSKATVSINAFTKDIVPHKSHSVKHLFFLRMGTVPFLRNFLILGTVPILRNSISSALSSWIYPSPFPGQSFECCVLQSEFSIVYNVLVLAIFLFHKASYHRLIA